MGQKISKSMKEDIVVKASLEKQEINDKAQEIDNSLYECIQILQKFREEKSEIFAKYLDLQIRIKKEEDYGDQNLT